MNDLDQKEWVSLQAEKTNAVILDVRVTLIVPRLDVMKDPTFPAMIIEIKVGANSKIID